MIDFNRAAMLLHVCDKAKNWPNLRPLHDAAMNELLSLQAPPVPVQPKAIPSENGNGRRA